MTDEVWLAGYFQLNVWVEAGIAYGDPVGNRRYYYWASQRPGNSYAEHDDTADGQPPLGGVDSEKEATAYPKDDTSFYVESGPYFGTSGGWPSTYLFNTLQGGTETTNKGGAVTYTGGVDDLGWTSRNDNYVYGWDYESDDTYGVRTPSSWGYITTQTANVHYSEGASPYPC